MWPANRLAGPSPRFRPRCGCSSPPPLVSSRARRGRRCCRHRLHIQGVQPAIDLDVPISGVASTRPSRLRASMCPSPVCSRMSPLAPSTVDAAVAVSISTLPSTACNAHRAVAGMNLYTTAERLRLNGAVSRVYLHGRHPWACGPQCAGPRCRAPGKAQCPVTRALTCTLSPSSRSICNSCSARTPRR